MGVASWGAGKLKETQSQFFSPTVQADAGPGKVTGWGSYSGASEFAGWIDDLAKYMFHDMAWTFYPRPGGVTGEWTVSSVESIATGEKTGAFTGVNLFDIGADNLISRVQLVTDNSPMEALFSDDMSLCKRLVNAWATGTLTSDWRSANLSADCKVFAGDKDIPGFGSYTMDTMQNWIDDLQQYEFPNMKWSFFPMPTGCLAYYTVDSIIKSSNGKGTGPMTVVTFMTVDANGKISDLNITGYDFAELAALH